MDRHDQELLDKQLRAIYRPPLQSGLAAMAIVTIFLVGVIAGAALTRASTPPIAANGLAIAFLDTGAAITQN